MTVEFLTSSERNWPTSSSWRPSERSRIEGGQSFFVQGKEMGQQTSTKPRTRHDFWIWRQADKVVCRMEVRGLALHLQYRWYGSHWFLSDGTHVAASAKQLLHTRLADFASAASCTATSRRIRHP